MSQSKKPPVGPNPSGVHSAAAVVAATNAASINASNAKAAALSISKSAPSSPATAPSTPPPSSLPPKSLSLPQSSSSSSNSTPSASSSSSQATSPSSDANSNMKIISTPEWGIYVSTLAGVLPSIFSSHSHDNSSKSSSVSASPPPATTSDEGNSTGEKTTGKSQSTSSSSSDDPHSTPTRSDDDEDSSDDVPVSFDSARFFFPTSMCPSRDSKHLLCSDAHAIKHLNTAKKKVGVLSRIEGAVGLFRDVRGNIYIAHTSGNCIKRISAKGELQHIAGSTKGAAGYVNAVGATARFNSPTAICSNGGGAEASATSTDAAAGKSNPLLFFVCDSLNCCIRVLTDKGVVSTLAGSPPEKILATYHANPATSSTATPHSSSNSSQKSSSSVTCVKFGDSSIIPAVIDGPVSMATFLRPTSCSFDHTDQSLVICDADAHCIRRLSSSGIVWTIAGSTHGERGFVDAAAFLARFSDPIAVTIDSASRIFVADRSNHAIRVITPAGFVYTVAGTGKQGYKNGSSNYAQFFAPSGLCFDQHSQLCVCDSNNHLVRRIQFVTLPLSNSQTYIGNTTAILQKEWVEFQEKQIMNARQNEIRVIKLEKELIETRKDLQEFRKSTVEEFNKVRQEMMQIMHQLLSSMQQITTK